MQPDFQHAYKQPEMVYDMEEDEDSKCVYNFVDGKSDDEDDNNDNNGGDFEGKARVHQEGWFEDGKGKEKVTDYTRSDDRQGNWEGQHSTDNTGADEEEQEELLPPTAIRTRRGSDIDEKEEGSHSTTTDSEESTSPSNEATEDANDKSGHTNVVQTVGGWNPFRVITVVFCCCVVDGVGFAFFFFTTTKKYYCVGLRYAHNHSRPRFTPYFYTGSGRATLELR